ncbi:predicted protein [Uncinocarpus reesii 1704]|uniref:Uncharacterized protein n=1 Tax=Uncinocarpus reesii (strain UAMH 1704) TaxID=336963 RepID=C4JK81_UNCRE|nr:uncharacterized protein UREG_02038 [Uncinocarpus reesii 1704]EEP77189.1 predicted protein [Uncinocarpus reesii 1704]
MNQLPPSPPPEPRSEPPQPVPLTAVSRTTPIHELLPDIRIPASPLPPHRYDPVTCTPLDIIQLRSELQQLRKEYTTSVAALKAQTEAAKEPGNDDDMHHITQFQNRFLKEIPELPLRICGAPLAPYMQSRLALGEGYGRITYDSLSIATRFLNEFAGTQYLIQPIIFEQPSIVEWY